eukprot:PITA_31251
MVNTTQNPVAVPTNPVQLAEFNKKNANAKRLILEGVKDHVIPHVRQKTYAHEMWTTLTSVYQSSNENRKMVLKEKLKAIKMAKTCSATAYLTKITSMRDELAVVGLFGVIRNNHLGAAKQVEEDDNVALLERGKKGRAKKQASNSGGKGKGKGKRQNKDKYYSKVKCWNCQKLGHYVVVCPKKKNKKGRDKPMASSAEIESFSESFGREFGFIACEATSARSPAIQVQRECALSTTSRASSSIWYVDSGASYRMTGVREYFSELSDDATDMEVVLGDDSIVKAVGMGTLTFDRGPKPPLKVSDVLYVPGMNKNLISVSTLEDTGYDVLFRRGQVLIYPRGTPASSARVIGVHHAKVYKFSFQPLMALSSNTRERTDSRSSSSKLCEIWHRKIGHMYHRALSTLWEITTGVPDFNSNHLDVCKGCAMGKFVRSLFPNSDSRATMILDLIHIDVSGQMSHVSLSGYEYYVLFIDDHSRKTWIYFLKTKSEVVKRFQEFKALVETETGRKIKVLKSNNGGEYTLGEFVDFFAEAGIRREFTIPYNPQ